MSNIRFHLLTTQDANDAESPNFVPVIPAKDVLAFNAATRLLVVCQALPYFILRLAKLELANEIGALVSLHMN